MEEEGILTHSHSQLAKQPIEIEPLLRICISGEPEGDVQDD